MSQNTHPPIPVREQVMLAGFEPSDVASLVRHINDPTVYQNTATIPSPYTEADAEAWFRIVQQNLEAHSLPCNWAIRHESAGLIGVISCFCRTGATGHKDEIGYWLAAPFRGQGLMTDVVRAFCAWLWASRPQLVRIEAWVYAHNPASARLLEKAGFEREGYARKFEYKDGAHIDALLLALLR
jgi:RimJ/RimL family protein N-acetyltransferase